ncbi:MAG: hypothetical protein WCK31_04450 [bacterium]
MSTIPVSNKIDSMLAVLKVSKVVVIVYIVIFLIAVWIFGVVASNIISYLPELSKHNNQIFNFNNIAAFSVVGIAGLIQGVIILTSNLFIVQKLITFVKSIKINVYTSENSKIFRQIAILLGVIFFMQIPSFNALSTLILAILALILSDIFKDAKKLKEDNSLTI